MRKWQVHEESESKNEKWNRSIAPTTQSQIRRITCLIYDFQPLTPHTICHTPPPSLVLVLLLFKRLNRFTLHPSCNHIHILLTLFSSFLFRRYFTFDIHRFRTAPRPKAILYILLLYIGTHIFVTLKVCAYV